MKHVLLGSLMFAAALAHAEDDKPKEEPKRSDGAIHLESFFVGDKEQPAISYFIPWQGVGAPDKLNWNMESKHDEALDPVDREVMLRSMELYDDLDLEVPQP